MTTKRSQELFERAQACIPGGVNSPVRAFRAVGGDPVFIERASGSHVWDVDGNRYLDFVGSWGPLILGHAHPRVVEVVRKAAERGTSYGAPHALEIEMAEFICAGLPSIEMVRMTSSGTEAAMSVLRLARGFTGRDRIIKFEGCYHGHVDSLLVRAGSGALTLGQPDSAGVPADLARHTLTVPYNRPDLLQRLVDEVGSQVAALIVEPVAGNMGVVPPAPGFLQFLRELTAAHGILLIFDEVITGFRVGLGGAQGRYGIRPDLTMLGKIIGGGLPVGAYGGRRDIMSQVAPLGPVYQAGTLSGNPLALAAGLETLRILSETPRIYEQLEEKGAALAESAAAAAEAAGIPLTVNRVGSMLTVFFTDAPVTDHESAKRADTRRYARFFRGMLAEGIALAPSQFEAAFVSAAHTDAELEQAASAVGRVLRGLAS